MLPLASFTPTMFGISASRARVAGSRFAPVRPGNVVENDRLFAHGLGNRVEVPVLAFLRGLVVIGRRGENGIDAWPRGNSLAFSTASCVEFEVAPATMGTRPATTSIVVSITCSHSSCDERGSFASGAAGDQKIDAGFHLPRHQVAQGSVVDRSILMKRSDERGTTATKLHEYKITRMGCARKRGVYNSRHTSLKSKKPFFPASHSAARTAPSAKPRRDLASWQNRSCQRRIRARPRACPRRRLRGRK